MSSPLDSLDTMHTGVPHVAVDLSTEISLAAVTVVVVEPVETPVSKHSLLLADRHPIMNMASKIAKFFSVKNWLNISDFFSLKNIRLEAQVKKKKLFTFFFKNTLFFYEILPKIKIQIHNQASIYQRLFKLRKC